jgi:hypothetical protein
VTVDEIAEAADVGRMTVYNYYPARRTCCSFVTKKTATRALLRAATERSRCREPNFPKKPASKIVPLPQRFSRAGSLVFSCPHSPCRL